MGQVRAGRGRGSRKGERREGVAKTMGSKKARCCRLSIQVLAWARQEMREVRFERGKRVRRGGRGRAGVKGGGCGTDNGQKNSILLQARSIV